jgi:hypothetical protein
VQVHRDVVAKTTTGRRIIQASEWEHGVDHALAAQPIRYGNRSCQQQRPVGVPPAQAA